MSRPGQARPTHGLVADGVIELAAARSATAMRSRGAY